MTLPAQPRDGHDVGVMDLASHDLIGPADLLEIWCPEPTQPEVAAGPGLGLGSATAPAARVAADLDALWV